MPPTLGRSRFHIVLTFAFVLFLALPSALAVDDDGVKVYKVDRTDVTLFIDDSTNITLLPRGIDIIDGSVVFRSSLCEWPVSDHQASLRRIFGLVRAITRYLEFQGPFTCLESFDFLGNLTTIQAQGSQVGLSISFNPQSDLGALRFLGLNSLRTVLGTVIVQYSSSGLPACTGDCMPSQAGSFLGFDLTAIVPGTVQLSSGALTLKTFNGTSYQILVPTTSRTVAACHSSCASGACSRPDDPTACQQSCDEACGTRGCSPSGSCCPASCLGGCDDEMRCTLCQDGLLLGPDGVCVSACPSNYSEFGWFFEPVQDCPNAFDRVLKPYVCVKDCPGFTAQSNGVCEITCPGALRPIDGRCPPVPPELNEYKICQGIFDLTQTCQLDIIDSQDCDTLAGSVLISPTSSIGQANDIQMRVLRKLRRVAGRVYVFQSFLSSLGFLENAVRIDGQHLNDRPVLEIEGNVMLRVLGLRSLRHVGLGQIWLRNNPFLCLHETVDWKRLNPSFDLSQDLVQGFTYEFYQENKDPFFINMLWNQFSGAVKHPVTCNGISCDSFCLDQQGNGSCWDTWPNACQRCPDGFVLEEGHCRSECSPGYYRDEWGCRKCHPTCGTCFGPDNTQCNSCAGQLLLSSTSCVESCGLASYATVNASCDQCDPKCLECNGPSESQCQQCQPGNFLQPDGSTCLASCPPGHFPDPVTGACVQCGSDCVRCFSTDSCSLCGNERYLDLNNDECVATCPDEYFGAGQDDQGRQCRRCRTCSSGTEFEVRNCTTASDRQCALCRTCAFPDEYRAETCTANRDTLCLPIRPCNTSVSFEAGPPTPTSDRVCLPLRQCKNNEFEARAPTPSADRACNPVRNCSAGFFETTPPTATSNRGCSPCSGCEAGFVKVGGCDGTNDTVCARAQGCAGLPCTNGGTCVAQAQEPFFQCVCPQGTSGTTCSLSATSSNDSQATMVAAIAAAAGAVVLLLIIVTVVMSRRHKKDQPSVTIRGDRFELKRKCVTKGEKIGGGNFGVVYSGMVRDPDVADRQQGLPVAIKELKPNANESDVEDFEKEMFLMMHMLGGTKSQGRKRVSVPHKPAGRHVNVLCMVGVCTTKEPVQLVLEYCHYGNLLNYLKNAAASEDRRARLDELQLADISTQIAEGMRFLAVNGIVHRDLAARNVLLAKDPDIQSNDSSDDAKYEHVPVVKISDFGMARHTNESEYMKSGEGKKVAFPVRWTAPEVLNPTAFGHGYKEHHFTEKSDVWAFGIVLWEIQTFGLRPYQGMTNEEVMSFVMSPTNRLNRPETCPPSVYGIMMNCWKHQPEKRTNFTDLVSALAECAQRERQEFQDPSEGSMELVFRAAMLSKDSGTFDPHTPSTATNRRPYRKNRISAMSDISQATAGTSGSISLDSHGYVAPASGDGYLAPVVTGPIRRDLQTDAVNPMFDAASAAEREPRQGPHDYAILIDPPSPNLGSGQGSRSGTESTSDEQLPGTVEQTRAAGHSQAVAEDYHLAENIVNDYQVADGAGAPVARNDSDI